MKRNKPSFFILFFILDSLDWILTVYAKAKAKLEPKFQKPLSALTNPNSNIWEFNWVLVRHGFQKNVGETFHFAVLVFSFLV